MLDVEGKKADEPRSADGCRAELHFSFTPLLNEYYRREGEQLRVGLSAAAACFESCVHACVRAGLPRQEVLSVFLAVCQAHGAGWRLQLEASSANSGDG